MSKPTSCPLCHSPKVEAYQCGWATIHCRNCYLSLSRAVPLSALIAIWNERDNVEPLLEALRYKRAVVQDSLF